MGPQYGDMVRNRLGVGGTDADIDHGDAAVTRFDQMIGRHLRHAQGRGAHFRRGLARFGDQIARLHECRVSATAIRHQFAGMEAELIDVELVVREQDEVLKMLRACRGVVRQAME